MIKKIFYIIYFVNMLFFLLFHFSTYILSYPRFVELIAYSVAAAIFLVLSFIFIYFSVKSIIE